MSDETKKNLEVITLVISITIACLAAIKAWALTPYRLEQVESAQRSTSSEVHSLEVEQFKLSGDIRESLSEIRASQGQFKADIAEIKADLKSMKK